MFSDNFTEYFYFINRKIEPKNGSNSSLLERMENSHCVPFAADRALL